jgi:hypothetical protein
MYIDVLWSINHRESMEFNTLIIEGKTKIMNVNFKYQSEAILKCTRRCNKIETSIERE